MCALFKLNKWMNTWSDRHFRNNTNFNWSVIEYGLNWIKSHIDSSINNMNKRIDNLIINAVGDSNAEVVDARFNKVTGETFPIISNRLDTEYERIIKLINNNHLDITNFGAVEGTDVTNIIQQLLSTAKVAPIRVYIPAGEWPLSSVLRIYKNTHFLMHPQASLIRKHDEDMFINGDLDDAFHEYGGNGSIIIEGGILEGNALEHPDGFNGINFGHAQGLIFKEITIRDVSYAHGIEINACKDVLFDGCRFEGFYDPTPTKERYISEAIQLDLAKNKEVFEPFGDYDNTPCHNVKVINCYFGASENFPAWNRGIGSHSCTHNRWHDTIRILNNTFESIQDYSVYVFKWNNVIISENNLNNAAGIAVRIPNPGTESTKDIDGNQTNITQPCKNIEISKNIMDFVSKQQAIRIYGDTSGVCLENINVINNIIDGIAEEKRCIQFGFVNTANITGNKFRNITGTGIHVVSCKNIIADANIGTDIRSEGIKVEGEGTDNIYLINNLLSNIWYHGITIRDNAKDVRILNNCIDNASQFEENRYDGILIYSNSDFLRVTDNIVRRTDNRRRMRYGIQITSSCHGVVRYGNYLKNSGMTAALLDDSINPITTPTDIV